MAGSNGKQKTVRDMILSLGLIGIAAALIYVFIPHEDSAPDIKPVDYRVELLTARRAAAYPVAAPEGLSKDWKATSVRFQGDNFDAWHLGFHTPDAQYVQIEQSTQRPSEFIDDASQGASATKATQRIDGRTWTRYTGGRYDALVLTGKGSTTVVAGTGSFQQLTEMAQALKTS
ncbi:MULTISPECIES: DUF4245 domain-containing protein [unclassified Streptomyces]|uniref:DUF4245 domain-containing protein n=1 Tax=unclassified Streptomyces TaxID=2593676 RepID=UPI002258D3BB|nr:MULTISPECIES: DUF4245 domain-containing protein [unclassified Streptomyces]MCX5050773.1 DUF4245 domain-containing protein [Streptomyces sp. NBC_00474]MCX5061149.1 DUF4245 domain-containing protein [Streptomyces sp. NBC_00452]MCX5248680.1 DUF4245 domain-containing protein [Streptomyces sp. NBC_00201]MCX5293226.1 DUF4245 domain-containing protein [Streptomyces sp. NBC_00183]